MTTMPTTIKTAALALAATAVTTPALTTSAVAHPGEHSLHSAYEMVTHALGSPFHVLGIGAAIVVAILIARGAKRRAAKARS